MAFTGAAIFGAVSSIAGAAATIAPIVSVGAGVAGIVRGASGGGPAPSMPKLQEAPRVPDYAAIQSAEKLNIVRSAQNRTRTVLTNPMGDTSGAVIKAKQLVGKLGD